jgi:hypothetical protein
MLFCDQPNLEKWSPNFSTSGQSSPVWTRVRYGRAELCNSLEWTDWTANPVQVQICDACGTPGCASGGYVHVSALTDLVLWTLPQPSEISERHNCAATATERFGSVAFPKTVWDSFRAAAYEVPVIERLPRSEGNALRDAWAAGQGRPKAPSDLLPWLRSRLLAADTLEVAVAIERIECWLNWFQQQTGTAVGAIVHRADEVGATIEKFYFDGPGVDDWAALARYQDSYVPALGPNHILIPDAATP